MKGQASFWPLKQQVSFFSIATISGKKHRYFFCLFNKPVSFPLLKPSDSVSRQKK
jgi:hypothetical protein